MLCKSSYVTGYSGVGKTSLINEVHKPLVRDKGYFISGKQDQFTRGSPYSSIIQAFKQLIQTILTETEQSIQYLRSNLLAAFNGKGQVIVDVIPEGLSSNSIIFVASS
jgi:predicted ATPase